MRILLTGATGYIGKRLLPVLVENGYSVVCCVRDTSRFNPPKVLLPYIEVIQIDFLEKSTLDRIPTDIDAAYYLIHSMSNSSNYQELEEESAINFRDVINKTNARQVIYLSGIVNETVLSDHLMSRKNVESILEGNEFSLTTLRAGIIIGSGSASFEIIRDLVEKLPVMIAPKWLNTRSQPIGIRDVIRFLEGSLLNEKVFDQNFDIGGPDILSYKEMLLEFAKFRKLKRQIYTVPIMTPKLSSYWLYFVTSTSYKLATSLVDSMKIEVVCRSNEIDKLLNINTESYERALSRAFSKINNDDILSSWKDSLASGVRYFNTSEFIDVPSFGCFKDTRKQKPISVQASIKKLWQIGGKNGWYYANSLWKIRGYIDKLFGGVGLRRGRKSYTLLEAGDALDFWRVLYANESEGRLLLFAEMKLPGEAWLEFKFQDGLLIQTATFRPHGILGRLYWYVVLPLHGIIFNGLLSQIARAKEG